MFRAALGVLALGLLVLGFAVLYSIWEDSSHQNEKDPRQVKNPPNLHIINHSQFTDVDKFTVRGTLTNTGSEVWLYATITLRITAENILVTECETTVFEDIPPGSRQPFLVACKGTATRLPFPARYNVTVSGARRGDG
jgi:hypothetical protein